MAVAARSTEDIQRDVLDQLAWDMRIDESNISVEVRDGTVTLTGTVRDARTSQAIEEIARYTEGVLEVENNLRVAP